MTAKQFQDLFRDLIHKAKSENPCPLAQIILELETEKTKCVNIFIELESQKQAREMVKQIIPANKMPAPTFEN